MFKELISKYKQKLEDHRAKYAKPEVDPVLRQNMIDRGWDDKMINQQFGANSSMPPSPTPQSTAPGVIKPNNDLHSGLVEKVDIKGDQIVKSQTIPEKQYKQEAKQQPQPAIPNPVTQSQQPQPPRPEIKKPELPSQPPRPEMEKPELEYKTDTQFQEFVPNQYRKQIDKSSKEFGVDPRFVSAIIMTENRGWDPSATPRSWAPSSTSIGLGQINDATQKDIEKIVGEFDRENPAESIRAVSAWLSEIRRRIGSDDLGDIANAYNQGISGHLNGRRNDEYIDTVIGYDK